MQSSFIIAQILGPMYVVVAAGLLLNPVAYQRVFEEFFESPALTYLGGLLALTFGLAILAFHHTWNADWTVVVTLIGWLGLIKGSLLAVWPGAMIRLSRPLTAKPARLRIMAAVPLALGLFLSLEGYGLV